MISPFSIRQQSSTSVSANIDGGRLLPGSGTDKVLYYVTDHLGSVRVVKDGSGAIRQRYDYYPYGSVTRSWTSSSTTDNSEKRFRFGGKEITGTTLGALSGGADKYLDFGARLYSPGTAMWLSQDPLAEKYYPLTPYMYCAGSPGNVVDPRGEDWFQNTRTGEIYFNESFSFIHTGAGYMSDDAENWKFLAQNCFFSLPDSYLVENFGTQTPVGGFSFIGKQAEKAMESVGYELRPWAEHVEVTRETEYYPEGLDEISISYENTTSLDIEKSIYVNKDYYQIITSKQQEGAVSRDYSSVFPRRYTVEKWRERRTYSYSPQKPTNNGHSLFKNIIFIIIKSISNSYN